jgi:hypothetical protein
MMNQQIDGMKGNILLIIEVAQKIVHVQTVIPVLILLLLLPRHLLQLAPHVLQYLINPVVLKSAIQELELLDLQ